MSAATVCDHCGHLIDFDADCAAHVRLHEPEPFGYGRNEVARADLHERCHLAWLRKHGVLAEADS